MKLRLLLILFAALAWGNTCTSTSTGTNWSSASHWTSCGGTIPGNGDTATISNATVVDANVTVGTSPATGGTVALTVSASLEVATGVELRIRGPVTQGSAGFTMDAGSILTFDASQASSPTSQTYAWTSNGFGRGSRMITMSGTSGSHVTVRSDSGGGNGYFYSAPGYNDSLWLNGTYVDFQRIGDATNYSWKFNSQSDTTLITIKNSTFDAACGRITITAGPLNGGWDIEDVKFSQTNVPYDSGNSAYIGTTFGNSNGTVTGSRKVYRCVFVDPPFLPPNGLDMQDNVFLQGWVGASNASPAVGMVGTFRYGTDNNGVLWGGSVTDSMFLLDASTTASDSGTATSAGSTTLVDTTKAWTSSQWNPSNLVYLVEIISGTGIGQRRLITGTTATSLTIAYRWDVTPTAGSMYQIKSDAYNPHFLNMTSTPTGQTITYDGLVFQLAGTDTEGDCILHMDAANTYHIIHELVLPNAMGDSSCTPITYFSSDTSQVSVEKSTWFSGAQSMSISEQTAGVAGVVTKVKSNIAWADPSRSYYAHGGDPGPFLVASVVGAAADTSDVIAVGAADYNATWGVGNGYAKTTLFPGTAGIGYDAKFSAAPGTHDVHANPNFVDSTRSFWRWAAYRGSTATTIAGQIADGVSYLVADPTLTRSSLIPWIRAGFAPQNAAYHNSGYDGGDIGAVAYQAAASAAVVMTPIWH